VSTRFQKVTLDRLSELISDAPVATTYANSDAPTSMVKIVNAYSAVFPGPMSPKPTLVKTVTTQ